MMLGIYTFIENIAKPYRKIIMYVDRFVTKIYLRGLWENVNYQLTKNEYLQTLLVL